MDWNAFFEKTRQAAEVESFAKLAPLIGVTDGAVSHYRVGRSVPQVWVVAECLRIQGHAEPEKEAIRIMKSEARTSTERTFYRKLLATTALVFVFAFPWTNPALAYADSQHMNGSTNYRLCEIAARVGRWLIRAVLAVLGRTPSRYAKSNATSALLA